MNLPANQLARVLVVIVSLFLFQSADAQNRSKLIDATDPERIADTIRELGYRARLEASDDASASIFSSVGGTEFVIQFLGCDDDNENCGVLLFKAGFDLDEGTTLEKVEEFNEMTLIGRAWLDDENDPWLEYSVNLFGGVTQTNFADTFDWWEVIVAEFENHIGF